MLLSKISSVFKKVISIISDYSNSVKTEPTKSNRTEYIFISKEIGFKIQNGFQKHIESFSNKRLVAIYNEILRMKGIPNLGNLQGLYIMIMHDEFINRFEKSPFIKKDDLNYSLGKPLVYIEVLETFIELELN